MAEVTVTAFTLDPGENESDHVVTGNSEPGNRWTLRIKRRAERPNTQPILASTTTLGNITFEQAQVIAAVFLAAWEEGQQERKVFEQRLSTISQQRPEINDGGDTSEEVKQART